MRKLKPTGKPRTMVAYSADIATYTRLWSGDCEEFSFWSGRAIVEALKQPV